MRSFQDFAWALALVESGRSEIKCYVPWDQLRKLGRVGGGRGFRLKETVHADAKKSNANTNLVKVQLWIPFAFRKACFQKECRGFDDTQARRDDTQLSLSKQRLEAPAEVFPAEILVVRKF